MTREKAVSIGTELEKVLRAFAMEHGIGFDKARVRFDSAGLTYSAEFSEQTASGASAVAERDYRMCAPLLGLDPDTFGKSFVARGARYTISGVLPRAKRQPLLADAADGTRYRFEPSYIALLAKAGRLS